MSSIIAIASQKGGVGKTATAVNLSAALAELGQRVLAVDLDPQGGLTLSCGYEPDAVDRTLYDALRRGEGGDSIRLPTPFQAELLPANVDLALSELELVHAIAWDRRLAAVLAPIRDEYDVVVIDCPPSLGVLTLNALAVSDGVIVPVACEYLAMRAVNGLLQFVQKVRGQANSSLQVIGLLPTMFDRRTRHAEETLKALRAAYEPNVKVLKYVVYRSIRFAEAAARGEPAIFTARATPGAEAYRELARDLVRGKLWPRYGRAG